MATETLPRQGPPFPLPEGADAPAPPCPHCGLQGAILYPPEHPGPWYCGRCGGLFRRPDALHCPECVAESWGRTGGRCESRNRGPE